MKKEKIKVDLLDRLEGELGNTLKKEYINNQKEFDYLKEIRLRVNKEIQMISVNNSWFLKYKPSFQDLAVVLKTLCNSSVYAYEKSIKEGFITIKGGYRLGLAGRYVDDKGILSISSLNIRIGCEIKGCSNKIINSLFNDKGDFQNTVLVSPPGCGKTTLLRD